MTELTTTLEEQLAVLDELAARIHNNALEKGFYMQFVSEDSKPQLVMDDNLVGMKLALVHSEVTEILEAIRKHQGTDAIGAEFADVLIRLLDLYHVLRSTSYYGELPSLADATAGKIYKNEGRPHMHGGVKF